MNNYGGRFFADFKFEIIEILRTQSGNHPSLVIIWGYLNYFA